MPRQARLDAPGTLHQVIIRGIEKKEIVTDNTDFRKGEKKKGPSRSSAMNVEMIELISKS